MIYRLGERTPELRGEHHFVADNATVIGSVILEENVSIWFNAVVRGDIETIHIGANSNVQDSAVLHTDPGTPLNIAENVTIGHQAMLHGCTVGSGSLIGINAVLLNNCVIGKNCLIGAHALVAEGKIVPDNSLVVGTPGRVIRQLTDTEIAAMHDNTIHYVEQMMHYKEQLIPIAI